MKKKYMWCMSLVVLVTSCGNKSANNIERETSAPETSEVIRSGEDTFEPEYEGEAGLENLPEHAYELFDDFIFDFAQNKRLQLSRVSFPLPVIENGDTTYLKKEKWVHDSFFMRNDYYTALFNDDMQMELEKSTDLNHVDVEWFALDENKLVVYHFMRQSGKWMLIAKESKSIEGCELSDFINFYSKFVNDSVFQMQSLSDPIRFVTPDPEDDFGMIEGTLDNEQWVSFRPELPKKHITNIRYGQTYDDAGRMIFCKRGIANGMLDILTFEKNDGEWKLVSYEN